MPLPVPHMSAQCMAVAVPRLLLFPAAKFSGEGKELKGEQQPHSPPGFQNHVTGEALVRPCTDQLVTYSSLLMWHSITSPRVDSEFRVH